MEKVFASVRSPLEIPVAVARTSQSPFPLAAIKTEFALYNPHSFEIQFIKSFQSHKIENLK